jgi:hypothetical protein
MSDMKLGRPFRLGPITPVVDALVFGAAPDEQPLSVTGLRERKIDVSLAGVPVYEGDDYTIVRNDDREPIAVASVAGGALDAGGNVSVSFTEATFLADDDSESFNTAAQQLRVTIDGSSGGGCTVNTQGSADGGASWYDLGLPFAVAAAETRTRMIEEPTSSLRVQLTAVAGPIEVLVQEND